MEAATARAAGGAVPAGLTAPTGAGESLLQVLSVVSYVMVRIMTEARFAGYGA